MYIVVYAITGQLTCTVRRGCGDAGAHSASSTHTRRVVMVTHSGVGALSLCSSAHWISRSVSRALLHPTVRTIHTKYRSLFATWRAVATARDDIPASWSVYSVTVLSTTSASSAPGRPSTAGMPRAVQHPTSERLWPKSPKKRSRKGQSVIPNPNSVLCCARGTRCSETWPGT